jgi:CheY-like chemotaxis protein
MTQIFLSYAGADEERVKNVHERLSAADFTPWMAARDIRFGEDWEYAVRQAISTSDFFIVCLTKNSNKRGYLQDEIEQALNIWRRMFQSDIYVIPARLEECPVPERLTNFHRADLFLPREWERLIDSLQEGMRRRQALRDAASEGLPADDPAGRISRPELSISSETSIIDSRRQKVLIVEDDRKLVIFIVDQIESMGFTTVVARDGIDALEQAHLEKPSLIILDIMMPKMDGYEVCRRVKSDPETKHIPVLMLSARGPLKDNSVALEAGADDYLAKPYGTDVFEARVKGLLNLNRLSQPSENTG